MYGDLSMSVNSVNGASSPAYYQAREPKSVKEFPDRYVYTYEEPARTGKKVGVGIASYFVSGLGQAINGEWGKACGFLAGSIGMYLLAGMSSLLPIISGRGKMNPLKSGTGVAGAVLGIMGMLGVKIWSIVDAVKHAKSNREIVVMKDN